MSSDQPIDAEISKMTRTQARLLLERLRAWAESKNLEWHKPIESDGAGGSIDLAHFRRYESGYPEGWLRYSLNFETPSEVCWPRIDIVASGLCNRPGPSRYYGGSNFAENFFDCLTMAWQDFYVLRWRG